MKELEMCFLLFSWLFLRDCYCWSHMLRN